MTNDVKIPIKFERQSTGLTCEAKALQLVLHFYEPSRFPLGKDLEMEIYRRAKLGRYDAATHPGLALVALEEGFDVDYIMAHENMFVYPEKKYPGYTMPRKEFEEKLKIDREYFEKAKKKGLKVVLIQELTSKILENYLNKLIPLIGLADFYGSLHAIILRGYKSNTFYIVDPIAGYYTTYKDRLIELLSTRYGVAILAIKKKT